MNRRAFLAAGLGLALPSLALACEPPAIYHLPFQADPAGADPAEIAAFVARTRPVVRNTSLARGAPGDSSLCGGMGYISVELALPPGTVRAARARFAAAGCGPAFTRLAEAAAAVTAPADSPQSGAGLRCGNRMLRVFSRWETVPSSPRSKTEWEISWARWN